MKERGITTIIHTGDVVDRRKYINYVSLHRMKKMFFNVARDNGIHVYVTVGNHDCTYKNTNRVNSMNELCDEYDNVTVISEPQEMLFGDTDVLLIPWINPENQEKSFELIKTTKAKVALGHLEIIGFEMYPGFVNEDGLKSELFADFDFVGSGHLHHKSSNGNIHYFGSPYETTWSDYKDPRGFHILDLATRELEFFENRYRMFSKIMYDESRDMITTTDFAKYARQIVKVVVINQRDVLTFDAFMDRLLKVSPFSVTVVDDHLNAMKESSQDILDMSEDTLTIVSRYINSLKINDTQKKAVSKTFHELYNEASSD